jgi:hypothetical protein
MLPGGLQDLDLRDPLGARQPIDMIEQLTTRQTPEIHTRIQTDTADTARWLSVQSDVVRSLLGEKGLR